MVVMAKMIGGMSEMDKEIKRLRHHVSVLSKRNHQLMKNDMSRAVLFSASDAFLSEDEKAVVNESMLSIVVEGTESQLVEVLKGIKESGRFLSFKLRMRSVIGERRENRRRLIV